MHNKVRHELLEHSVKVIFLAMHNQLIPLCSGSLFHAVLQGLTAGTNFGVSHRARAFRVPRKGTWD